MTLKCIGISRLRMGTDGEGIRTLVAAYGCPLRCKYCLNPQSWNEEAVVREFTVEELYRRVRIDNLYFLSTDGGITFGGGEPLLYAEFIKAFVGYTEHKWNIALETSLNVPQSALEKVLDCVDKFIVDIKSMSQDIYAEYTGGDNRQVVDNLTFLIGKVPVEKVVVRVPYIPGYTEDKDVEKSIENLKTMGIKQIEPFEYIMPDCI